MSKGRHLIVMRHAQSPARADVQRDRARPLSDLGREDARRVGEHLYELGWSPERVVSSDAVRTRQTWDEVGDAFREQGVDPDVQYTNELYGADLEDVCDQLWALETDVTRAAVVGHQPGLERIVEWLTDTNVSLPQGSAVLLEGSGDTWADAVQQHAWSFVEMIRPNALRLENQDE